MSGKFVGPSEWVVYHGNHVAFLYHGQTAGTRCLPMNSPMASCVEYPSTGDKAEVGDFMRCDGCEGAPVMLQSLRWEEAGSVNDVVDKLLEALSENRNGAMTKLEASLGMPDVVDKLLEAELAITHLTCFYSPKIGMVP